MEAVCEFAVHVRSFRNVDLFRQGLYHVAVRIFTVNPPTPANSNAAPVPLHGHALPESSAAKEHDRVKQDLHKARIQRYNSYYNKESKVKQFRSRLASIFTKGQGQKDKKKKGEFSYEGLEDPPGINPETRYRKDRMASPYCALDATQSVGGSYAAATKNDEKALYAAQVDNQQSTFRSRTVQIQYIDQEQPVNDVCLFRMELPTVEPSIVMMEMQLMFAERSSVDLSNGKELPSLDKFRSISTRTLRLDGLYDQNVNGYYPVQFSETYCCVVETMVHACVVDVKSVRVPRLASTPDCLQWGMMKAMWGGDVGARAARAAARTKSRSRSTSRQSVFSNSNGADRGLIDEDELALGNMAALARENTDKLWELADKYHTFAVGRLVHGFSSLLGCMTTLTQSAAASFSSSRMTTPVKDRSAATSRSSGGSHSKAKAASPSVSSTRETITSKVSLSLPRRLVADMPFDSEPVDEAQVDNLSILNDATAKERVSDSKHVTSSSSSSSYAECVAYNHLTHDEEGALVLVLPGFRVLSERLRPAYEGKELSHSDLEHIAEEIVRDAREIAPQVLMLWHEFSRVLCCVTESSAGAMSKQRLLQIKRVYGQYVFRHTQPDRFAVADPASPEEHNKVCAAVRGKPVGGVIVHIQDMETPTLPSDHVIVFEDTVLPVPRGEEEKEEGEEGGEASVGLEGKQRPRGGDEGESHGDLQEDEDVVDIGHLDVLQSPSSVALSTAAQDYSGPMRDVFVFVHGYQGNSMDLRLVRNQLKIMYPSCLCLLSDSNQGLTEGKIEDMGERLAQEVCNFVDGELNPGQLRHLSFICHSLGGLICRAALTHEALESYRENLHTYMSMATPHCGYLFGDSPLISAGMWVLKTWKKSDCLKELSLTDAPEKKDCFLVKLAAKKGLSYFSNCFIFACQNDNYAPYYSARIEQLPDKLQDSTPNGLAFQGMVTDLLTGSQHVPIFKRFDISFPNIKRSLDSFIGRSAHICFLDQHDYIVQILSSYSDVLFEPFS